jgi:hypothetical protein
VTQGRVLWNVKPGIMSEACDLKASVTEAIKISHIHSRGRTKLILGVSGQVVELTNSVAQEPEG